MSVAVLFSLVVARLLTPLMAAYFLGQPEPHRRGAAAARLLPRVAWPGPSTTAGLSVRRSGGVIFIVSIVLFVPLTKGVQPRGQPRTTYYVDIQGPPGATLADMRRTLARSPPCCRQVPRASDTSPRSARRPGRAGGGTRRA